MSDDHDRETRLLTGAFALNAVDDTEAAAVRELAARFPLVSDEVDSLTETAARLAETTSVMPPAQMRRHVLDQIRVTPQVAPARHRPAPTTPAAAPTPATPSTAERSTGTGTDDLATSRPADDESARVVPLRAGTRPPVPRWLAVAAGAVLVLALGVGSFAVLAQQRANSAEQMNVALSQVLAASDRELADAEFAGGHATLVTAGDRVVVVGTDVASPPAGKGYQLWMLQPDGEPIPSVMLTDAGDGRYWADVAGRRSDQRMAVTLEPEGGSQEPTSDAFFVTEQA